MINSNNMINSNKMMNSNNMMNSNRSESVKPGEAGGGKWEVFNIANRNVYIDLKNGKYSWTPPVPTKSSSSTKPRRSLDSSHIYREVNELRFIKLQAHCRGYLARKAFAEAFFEKQHCDAAVKIQAWWRALVVRIRTKRALAQQQSRPGRVEKQLSHHSARSAPVKRKRENDGFDDTMEHYRRNEEKIVRVQALWRGKMVRNIYMMLFNFGSPGRAGSKQPTYKMLKIFVKHLDTNIRDYHTALELQRMRTELAKLIIKNKSLTSFIEELDLKIGLLVQNRLSLSDILKCKNELALSASQEEINGAGQKKNALLDKFAHLLYILQVRPEYLVNLMLSVPPISQKFLQGITLTLFNSGSTSRDEYMLLRCLSLLLRQEVLHSDKYAKPLDIITTPPLAMKIIMHYARSKCGHMSLKTILKALIEKVLKENSVIAYTNPITIYNKWRGELEFTTGKTSDLPVNVDDVATALSYEHVSRTFNAGIQRLESVTNMFLKRLVASKEYIPYGLLYIVQELRSIMKEKFGNTAPADNEPLDKGSSEPVVLGGPSLYPDLKSLHSISHNTEPATTTSTTTPGGNKAQELQQNLDKDIIKVVGHYLYYNFLNSAIVAPEAYEIISLRPGQIINTEQRHNLATVAKLLQFSAAKKGYGEDTPYLMCLNKFISYCHEKLRVFFDQCCQVSSLEDQYAINEYSEELLATPPTIFTNLLDVAEFHSLLLTYKYDVCSDSSDVLLKLLHELNSGSMIYKAAGVPEGSSIGDQLQKTPISFVLSNKYGDELGLHETCSGEDNNIAKLFIQTKELLVVVLPCLEGHTLPGALRMESNKHQEDMFKARVVDIVKYNPSLCTYSAMSLKSAKVKLRKYLSTLEEYGYVSKDCGYQEIINKLIQDINNKNKYRQMQSKELRTVRQTRDCLLEKIQDSTEKINYYEKYIGSCLQNQSLGKRNVHLTICSNDKQDKKLQNKLTITYTGRQLFDKGILVEANGMDERQLKNVLIEIKPKETYGSFQFNGKFMGVVMQCEEINIQDLLQKKFLGISIMEIFSRTKVNVNLLLHLLNKKYYSKH
uniref:Ras GTPase-activating-like protein IQGAP2 n=1 Tax=Cacopsylla melanoneura TaxID=428564 RepID=A0A8D8YSY6_9HEMI